MSKKNEKNRISLFKTKSLIGKKRINDTNNEANIENSAYANHTRYTQDNIIKKIKAIFFKNSIDYINNYLNRYKQVYKNIIYLRHLNYAYVDKLKKDYDLLLLSMPLKYFASLDISSNYSSISDKQFNRKLIIDILEKEKENTKIINFLDMTFNDLIDILLYKNIFNKFISLDGIKDDLEAIAKKTDDKDYFSKFILISYNYKRWFINKKGRSIKNDNNSQDNQ